MGNSIHERFIKPARGLAVLVTAAVLIAPAFAQAAPQTYVANKLDDHTPNGCTHSDCTLREAVIKANAHPGRDTIKLRGATYKLALPTTGEDAAADGDLDLTGAVAIKGKGAGRTTVNGGGAPVGDSTFRVFAPATISGLTVRNSVAAAETGIFVESGGALQMSEAKVVDNQSTAGCCAGIASSAPVAALTLTHVLVANNAGGSEIGVNWSGKATLRHVAIRNNGTNSFGCCNGLDLSQNDRQATLEDVRVVNNDGNPGCCNGILFGDGRVILRRVVVSGNDGSGGGCCNGVELGDGRTTLRRVVVSNNDASGECCNGIEAGDGTLNLADVVVSGNDGAGGCCQGLETGDAPATIKRTTVSANSGSSDTGLNTSTGAVNLTNATVSGNSTTAGGAGISAGGPVSLNNVTVTLNKADTDDSGGGTGAGIIGGGDPFRLQNSIVAGNSVGLTGGGTDCSGNVVSGGHNLFGVTSGCTITGTTNGNLLGVDPKLGALHDNGGFTKTHALRRHSKAINHGSPKKPGSGGKACAKTDQRGVKRDDCDIGAYER